ncbi:MAG TPA: YdcH family protein [Stellaceae bacterium]|nr:YdcH family protein [Stellaceae bacterium]
MSETDRVGTLKEQHAALERAIDEETARPLPNRAAVADLKRQKLRIKDELYQLERH